MPLNSICDLPLINVGRPARSELKRSTRRSSSGSTLCLTASIRNSRCSSLSICWVFGGEVVRLRPVVRRIQLPHVIVKRRQLLPTSPRGAVARYGGPALVVDAAVDKHLEVLGLVPFGCLASSKL